MVSAFPVMLMAPPLSCQTRYQQCFDLKMTVLTIGDNGDGPRRRRARRSSRRDPSLRKETPEGPLLPSITMGMRLSTPFARQEHCCAPSRIVFFSTYEQLYTVRRYEWRACMQGICLQEACPLAKTLR